MDVRLGKETNWLAVAGNESAVVTLKADGTLWKWEFPSDPVNRPWTARAAKLSTHSDWVGITQEMGGVIGLAADGSLWLWRFEPRRSYSPDFLSHALLAPTRRPLKIASIFANAD